MIKQDKVPQILTFRANNMKKYLLLIFSVTLLLPVLVMAAGKIDAKFAERMKGRIMLQVQEHGEAWYINPADGKRYYLKDGAAAYEMMRKFGQGVLNSDLEKIPVGTFDTEAQTTKNSQKSVSSKSATQYQEQPSTPQTKQAISKEDQQNTYYTVTRVVDGDTFDVLIGEKTERIRGIGMDTPEVVDPRKPVQCFGKEASRKATELLLNKKVRLSSDPTQGERDKYNRLLRYAYLEDGLFFNKWMIEEGYATEYTYNIPYAFMAEFKNVAKTARENSKGLWAPDACATTQPEFSTEGQSSSEQESARTAPSDTHTWYLSTHYTARYYYCDTDTTWQGLSKKNLKSFSSQAELLKQYPNYTLHQPCK